MPEDINERTSYNFERKMHSNIIEIIGPPGIGKSTIYKSLCKTWRPRSRWIYPDVLLNPNPNFLVINKYLQYQFRKILGKKISKKIPVEYGLKFVGNNKELANFCWNHLSNTQVYSSEEIGKRFRSAYFLFTDYCRYQAILESISTKPCIIDEGFLQKSFFINDDVQFISESLNKYLPLLPLPRAIIYIDTSDTNTIVGRLRNRQKIIASQIGKDDKALKKDIEKWQHTLRLILEKIKVYNVSIIEVDGKNPIYENVSHINKMIDKIA